MGWCFRYRHFCTIPWIHVYSFKYYQLLKKILKYFVDLFIFVHQRQRGVDMDPDIHLTFVHKVSAFLYFQLATAAFGGIFSLCFGGSIISLFEFFYYWTFEFVERILQKKNKILEEKKRYRQFIGMNKNAKFKPIHQRKANFNMNSDYTTTTTYFN